MDNGARPQHTHPWATRPIADRLAWVRRFRRSLAEAEPQLAALAEEEVGKARLETLTADVLPVLATCRWLERRAPRLLAPRRLGGGGLVALGQRHRVARVPVGRVAIIATWNYPIGLLGIQLAQALAAGNTAVVKPSEHAPRTQALLLGLAARAGLPSGVLESVEPTREAGEALLREHAFDHVVFTGSTAVGRTIAATLAPSLTPSTLELSGRDSALVLHDADVDLAAEMIWFAATINGGQTCMAPKRALVDARCYDAFCRALASRAAGARPRRLIAEQAAAEVHNQARAAVAAGARPLCGVLEPPRGAWVRPAALADCPPGTDAVRGVNFGPLLAVVPCRDEASMLAIHHACDQHLATSVYTRRARRAERALAPRLGAHTVTINSTLIPTAHPGASIGGAGASGWGRSQGEAGLLAMTRPVSVSRSSSLLRPPVAEAPPERVERLAGVLRGLYGGRRGPGEAASAGERGAKQRPTGEIPAGARG